jgi:GT2 family glycosyltransferase
MADDLVSVSIVNYNNREYLDSCLRSVVGQDYPHIEVLLVDNGSTDGSVPFVKGRFPGVRVVENGANLHFCKGHNIGIRNSGGAFVLALNTDVVLEKDFITEMVKAAAADDRIGSVSGKVLRTGGRLIDTTGLSVGRSRKPVERGYGEQDRGQYETPGYVFGAGGVSPLYRRKMLDDVAVDGEYFDETYESYYEDMDLAWRAHIKGWKAYYTPRAVAYHMRGGSNKLFKPAFKFLRRYDYAYLSDAMKARIVKNRWLTMLKDDKPLDLLLNLPFIFLYDIKLWAYLIFFSPRAVPLALKGLGALPTAWRRRKQVHGI